MRLLKSGVRICVNSGAGSFRVSKPYIDSPLSVSPHRPNLPEAEELSTAYPILLPDAFSTNLLPNLRSIARHPQEIWLTDELLFQYQRCQRRAYLELYGNAEQRDPPSDYLAKLRQDSLTHQRHVLTDHPTQHRPKYARRDWLEGAAKTRALMQQGVERISEGVLLLELETGLKLVSCPNLLIKQPGLSNFGDWLYAPADIRLGKRPKMDYQIAVAFHTYVLAAVQGAWPETAWLMLRQRGSYAVDLFNMLPRMQETLQDCIQMLSEAREPEVFIAHSRCDLCQWSSYCYEIAQSSRHLSLLPGVTPSRYEQLKLLELTTVEVLATASPRQLENLPGFGLPVAQRLIWQAQAVLQNRAIADSTQTDQTDPAQRRLLSATELPTAEIELYFDIEAAPEQNLIYLHGVLVVDRLAQTERFYPMLARSADQEQLVWEQFLELVWRYPTAPIFHFCPYEVQTVRRLGELYGVSSELIERLIDRFVDLHERVTRVAILPVESYALKPIARWLGFDWQDAEANGAQSIFWYAQWLETGNADFLAAILRYNEDDCRATYRVKDWLAEFCQSSEA